MPGRTKSPAFHTLSLWATLVAVAASGGDDAVQVIAGVIDRETFVAAYVDLRTEALRGDSLDFPAEVRDSVLARHGVDAEALVDFIDAYGRDLDFMSDVWSEIERRLEAVPPSASPPAELADQL
jgi:hypothetical protein